MALVHLIKMPHEDLWSSQQKQTGRVPMGISQGSSQGEREQKEKRGPGKNKTDSQVGKPSQAGLKITGTATWGGHTLSLDKVICLQIEWPLEHWNSPKSHFYREKQQAKSSTPSPPPPLLFKYNHLGQALPGPSWIADHTQQSRHKPRGPNLQLSHWELGGENCQVE